ncbi:MAG: hypothetical protein P1U86_11970 [Verrucomicrobiales bacterium]|nr:hypothetical protein [Verrucomicrobiales bacterium]
MISHFFSTLFASGIPEITPPEGKLLPAILAAGTSPEEERALIHLLSLRFEIDSLSLPGSPLPFHPRAALWGALHLFRASCFFSFREIVDAEVERGLSTSPLPDPQNPESHFSADLALKYLPDLYQMALRVSEDDILVTQVKHLASSAPLSSAGIPATVAIASPVRTHPGLANLLVERAIRSQSRELLEESPFRQIAREKLGIYPAEMTRGLLS